MILTEEERAFASSMINCLYQNWNTRSLEPELLRSIFDKLQSNVVSFTEAESSRVQVLITDRRELYSRIADPRLQHILNTQNTQGFGQDHGNKGNFFNGPKMYQLCQSILAKLVG